MRGSAQSFRNLRESIPCIDTLHRGLCRPACGAQAAGAETDTSRGPAAQGSEGCASRQFNVKNTFRNICGFCHENYGRKAGKGPQLMGTPAHRRAAVQSHQERQAGPHGGLRRRISPTIRSTRSSPSFVLYDPTSTHEPCLPSISGRACGAALLLLALLAGVSRRSRHAPWPRSKRRARSPCARIRTHCRTRARKPIRPVFRSRSRRAIAAGLGVSLDMQWILPRRRASLVNCDILMDSINDPRSTKGKLLLSRPYQHTGVALGVGRRGRRSPLRRPAKGPEGRRDGQLAGAAWCWASAASALHPTRSSRTCWTTWSRASCSAPPPRRRRSPTTHASIRRPASAPVNAYDDEPQLAWDVVGRHAQVRSGTGRCGESSARSAAGRRHDHRIYAHYGVEHRAP